MSKSDQKSRKVPKSRNFPKSDQKSPEKSKSDQKNEKSKSTERPKSPEKSKDENFLTFEFFNLLRLAISRPVVSLGGSWPHSLDVEHFAAGAPSMVQAHVACKVHAHLRLRCTRVLAMYAASPRRGPLKFRPCALQAPRRAPLKNPKALKP